MSNRREMTGVSLPGTLYASCTAGSTFTPFAVHQQWLTGFRMLSAVGVVGRKRAHDLGEGDRAGANQRQPGIVKDGPVTPQSIVVNDFP